MCTPYILPRIREEGVELTVTTDGRKCGEPCGVQIICQAGLKIHPIGYIVCWRLYSLLKGFRLIVSTHVN